MTNQTRDEQFENALAAMQNALHHIANWGECHYAHDGGSDRPRPCTCPPCTATRALRTADDWRYMGARSYRTTNDWNPRETLIVQAWRDYMTSLGGPDQDMRLAQVLSEEPPDHRRDLLPSPSARDWFVATTVVQWLATNVGMTVLEAAGFKYQHFDRDRAAYDARRREEEGR